MSAWKDIYQILKDKGIVVYSPSTHEGECTSSYTVVKAGVQTEHASFSTNVQYYQVMVYVPKNRYSTLEDYKCEVKEAMKSLSPRITPTGQETASFYDDTVKGHMVSIEYKNNIKQ